MDGVFGGVEYQPFRFMQLTAEYDAVEFNSSVKFFTPKGVLPHDIAASLSYQLYSGHDSDEATVWNAAVSIPLISDYTRSVNFSQNDLSLRDRLFVEQKKFQDASISTLVSALKKRRFR